MTPLEETVLPSHPYPLFGRWRAAAEEHDDIAYAGAMTLSTVGPDGFPQGRVVLLHAASSADGFAFCTDARSAKGRALSQSPRAALAFYWGPLERQVRVQGRVDAASGPVADRFFAERPRRSRVTAWASHQSAPLPPGRASAVLAERMEEAEARFRGIKTIPRPPHWRAYYVRPRQVEFWEAKARRLHVRVRYERAETAEGWRALRLEP